MLTCRGGIPRANKTCQHAAKALRPHDILASELTPIDLTRHLVSTGSRQTLSIVHDQADALQLIYRKATCAWRLLAHLESHSPADDSRWGYWGATDLSCCKVVANLQTAFGS